MSTISWSDAIRDPRFTFGFSGTITGWQIKKNFHVKLKSLIDENLFQ